MRGTPHELHSRFSLGTAPSAFVTVSITERQPFIIDHTAVICCSAGSRSALILAIAVVFVRWIGATRPAHLLMVGCLWLALTQVFEILFGRFVVGASWERLAADYNVLKGGLLPFGMLVLMLSPLIAWKLRGSTS